MNFNSYINGKTVALVGGSDEIDWQEVNKCEVVARVNGHWMRQGGRCELLYYSCADDLDYEMWQRPDLFEQLEFAMVNRTHQLFGGYASEKTALVISKLVEHNIPHEFYYNAPGHAWDVFRELRNVKDGLWSRELSERYDFHPLTGIIALEHLLLSSAASVYVTGMTLYQQPDGALPADAGRHSIPPQLAYLKDNIKHKKLILSDRLAHIVAGLPYVTCKVIGFRSA